MVTHKLLPLEKQFHDETLKSPFLENVIALEQVHVVTPDEMLFDESFIFTEMIPPKEFSDMYMYI